MKDIEGCKDEGMVAVAVMIIAIPVWILMSYGMFLEHDLSNVPFINSLLATIAILFFSACVSILVGIAVVAALALVLFMIFVVAMIVILPFVLFSRWLIRNEILKV